MILDNFNLISWRTNKMNFRINLMWFLAMIIVVGISNADFYDFEGGGGFTLNGNAAVDSGSVMLTPNVGSQRGTVIFDSIPTDPIANFEVSFDFWIGPAGADGMCFALMDASHGLTALFGETGPGAGSLSVSFDTYQNSGDPSGNFVQIRLDDTSVATAIPTFSMESSQWHHADISFAGGNLTLVLTPEGGVAETLFDAVAVSGFTPFAGRYGFGARTGGSTSEHRVDNVSIGERRKAFNPSPADGEWFRYYTDVTELAWTLPPPLIDPNVTCDVLWFGTDPESTPELLVDKAAVELVSLGLRADAQAHYYWRVDCYDPNGGFELKTEGDLWTFSSARDIPMVFVDENPAGAESTTGSEEYPITSRDDYLLSLSSDPGSDTVTITVNTITNTWEEMEAGVGSDSAKLTVGYNGAGTAINSIVAGDDDAEQDLYEDGRMDRGSSDLEFFFDGSSQQIIGLRFQNVIIPQGATINSARVDFQVDSTSDHGEVYGIVTGENDPNARPIADTAYELSNRFAANPTTATSSFAWTADYSVGTIVPTGDISSVIQEIVDHVDWAPGNSILLFFTEDPYPAPVDIDFIDAEDPWASRSSTYVLDTNNWEGVTVTIVAIDDEVLEPDPEMVTLVHQVVGTGVWAGVQADPVEVTITDENECGAWSFEAYDFNLNCVVDLADLVELVNAWLTCTMPNIAGSGCVETYRP